MVVSGGKIGFREWSNPCGERPGVLDSCARGKGLADPPEREDAYGQTPVFQHALIALPLGKADAGILEPGHPFFVQRLRNVLDAASQLFCSRWRDEVGNEGHRRFFENACRCAVGIAIDRAAGRIRRRLRDPRELERERVRDAVMAHRMRQPYRVFRGDCIEVRSVDVASFRELALVPSMALYPTAVFEHFTLLVDHAGNVVDAFRVWVAQVEQVQEVGSTPGTMAMSVQKSRRRGLAAQVDALGLRTGQRLDLGVRADGHDATVPDRDRLGHAVVSVDGNNVAVHQNAICGRAFGRVRCAASGRYPDDKQRPAFRHVGLLCASAMKRTSMPARAERAAVIAAHGPAP